MNEFDPCVFKETLRLLARTFSLLFAGTLFEA